MNLHRWLLRGLLVLCSLPASGAETAPWAALREGGHVMILRHAETDPGIGDPPQFRLGDCSTQRNLSPAGRAQAQQMGKNIAGQGISVTEVLSSRWCRCMDTATEAFGRTTGWPVADSFFDARLASGGANAAATQTADLRRRVVEHRGRDTLVVVTHQVNITGLTGIHPAMGEAVILRPAPRRASGGFDVVARLTVP